MAMNALVFDVPLEEELMRDPLAELCQKHKDLIANLLGCCKQVS